MARLAADTENLMPSPSLEDRLKRVEARQAINNMIARYAHGADRKNAPEIMRPLFADNATWSAEGFDAFHGADAIAEGLAEIARKQVLWSIHYMTSPHIELSDDARHAACSWYLWELCTMRSDENNDDDHWLGGWYDAVAKLVNGEWKFTSVHLDIRLQGDASPPWKFKKPVS